MNVKLSDGMSFFNRFSLIEAVVKLADINELHSCCQIFTRLVFFLVMASVRLRKDMNRFVAPPGGGILRGMKMNENDTQTFTS